MISKTVKSFFSSGNIILLGIIITGILIVHNSVVAYLSDQALSKRNAFLEDRQFILQKIDQLGSNVNLIDLGVRGYYMITKDNLKDPLEIARRQHRADIDTLIHFMDKYSYPEHDSVTLVDHWIQGYFETADRAVSLIEAGTPEGAAEIYATDPGYTLWSKYSRVQNSMRSYVDQLEAENQAEYTSITTYAFIAQMLLLLVGGAILIIVIIRLLKQQKQLQGHFSKIVHSDQTYVYNDGNDYSRVDQTRAITLMEEHLRTAAHFIQQISQGKLDVKWTGLNKELMPLNKETLAGELIKMREKMIQVKKEEKDRLWHTEGISKFSEIIRTYQGDLQQMSDKLVAEVVKYLECNQGGLFYLDDEDNEHLALASCYAYDKIRFVDKKIHIDSGIIGQAFKEGEVIILKEIPDNYVNITSGLGESLPRHLAVVPLKVNESIEGVLELASFTEFTPIKIDLLDRISEIVASAVFNSKNAEEMKRLLQVAEENTAALRAQEEEIRQNMEELQAMNENSRRGETE